MSFERVDIGEDVTLYLGDCLEVLPTLEVGSVDTVVTDMPYGTTNARWDIPINLDLFWRYIDLILYGAYITTTNQPFTSRLVMSNIEKWKHEYVWDKVSPVNFLNCNHAPLMQHELIEVFKYGKMKYNPQKTGRKYIRWSLSKSKNSQVYRDGLEDVDGDGKNGWGFPRSIVVHPRPNHLFAEKVAHPTQKPLSLYRFLILTYSDATDIILDPFMGSGTTGVAAVQLGRKFIGIEIDPQYFAIAEKRIRQAMMQLRLEI